jgi:hypothetical protein
MSCPTTTNIERTQCIGNSLSIINENFFNLRVAACDNDTNITTLNNDILDLSTRVDTVSSLVVPGVSKAWCKFSGTKDTNNQISEFLTDRLIYSNFNILSVYKKAKGDYRILFETPFVNNKYAVICNSTEKLNTTNNKYTWAQPYNITSAYVEIRVQSSEAATTVDPDFVSLVIY